MAPTKKKPAAKKKPVAKKKPAAGKKAAPKRVKARAGKKKPLTSRRPKLTRKAPAKGRPQRALPENPEALALARLLAHAASDKKAEDVMVLDVRRRGASVGYDYVVLASGDTDRQLGAIAEGAEEAARKQGRRATSVESAPEWVLMNFDDVVAHFFTPEKRAVYDIEGLWVDAPRVRAS